MVKPSPANNNGVIIRIEHPVFADITYLIVQVEHRDRTAFYRQKFFNNLIHSLKPAFYLFKIVRVEIAWLGPFPAADPVTLLSPVLPVPDHHLRMSHNHTPGIPAPDHLGTAKGTRPHICPQTQFPDKVEKTCQVPVRGSPAFKIITALSAPFCRRLNFVYLPGDIKRNTI